MVYEDENSASFPPPTVTVVSHFNVFSFQVAASTDVWKRAYL